MPIGLYAELKYNRGVAPVWRPKCNAVSYHAGDGESWARRERSKSSRLSRARHDIEICPAHANGG